MILSDIPNFATCFPISFSIRTGMFFTLIAVFTSLNPVKSTPIKGLSYSAVSLSAVQSGGKKVMSFTCGIPGGQLDSSAYLLAKLRHMEKLGRGVVAMRVNTDSVYIGWRLLGTDPPEISFNLYRVIGENPAIRLNENPLSQSTNYLDSGADFLQATNYFVRTIINGKETSTSDSFTLPINPPVQQYLSIPLHTPSGYVPNDLSVGDLDGDGEYDLILHQAGRGRDNSSNGFTDPPIFQAYKTNGTFLWEINLGKNIREGAHYTQFIVYDLDSDGIAEFACKTADGTIDGLGNVIGDSTKDWRNRNGKILSGPEYFTIFNGKTGQAMATTDYIPGRDNLSGWGGVGGNGGNDNSGNRSDRFNAAVAYLDGVRPSIVMCRGYYGRTVLAAWDWRNGNLTSRWIFDSKDSTNSYSGMGNHNLSVADVDGDGKDEIIYGAMCVDDDGSGRYTTGLRHGDAIHVTDLDLDNPGLEVFGIHEIEAGTTGPGVAVFDASSGRILWRGMENQDIGRGVAANIDPGRTGAQMWWAGSNGLYDISGTKIGEQPVSTNFLIWWDADLSRELLDGNHIDKYGVGRIFTAEDCVSNNGSKSTPALSADLFGDWREEVVFRTSDNQNLRIYTTVTPSSNRYYTLMHDPQYRLSIAWQNVGYNQPPHTGFYFGPGMKDPPSPGIKLIGVRMNTEL